MRESRENAWIFRVCFEGLLNSTLMFSVGLFFIFLSLLNYFGSLSGYILDRFLEHFSKDLRANCSDKNEWISLPPAFLVI